MITLRAVVSAVTMLSFGALPVAIAQVPIDDHFDSALSPEWTIVRGGATVEDGWLVLSRADFGNPRDSVIAIRDGDTSIKDFILHVRVDPVPSGPGNVWNRAGVIFRSTDTFGPTFTGYGMSFVLAPDGSGVSRVTLSRVVNNAPVELARVDSFFPTEPMDVVVSAIGHSIKVYVNGSILFDLTDLDGPLSGGVGLWNVWESKGRYDDVLLVLVPPAFCPGDADGSRTIDFSDINAVLANWLNTCP